jgi:ADP-ribosylglycohydrolase
MYTKEKIAELNPAFDNFIGVESNVSAYNNHINKKGEWTDDTQLMRPIIWSIIETRAINPYDIAKFTRDIFNKEEKRGWSKSVISAAERLNSGVSWWEASGESVGVGCGVAMKAAPLGVYVSVYLPKDITYVPTVLFKNGTLLDSNLRHVINSIISVGQITHHEVGIRAGVLQSILIGLCINGTSNKKKILEYLANIELNFFGDHRFTTILKVASKLNTIEEIANTIGTGSKATESWVTAVLAFLKTNKKADAYKNLVELIRQGGDCDTTGAIFGSLIGARWGANVFPKNLVKEVEGGKELLDLADDLYYKVCA